MAYHSAFNALGGITRDQYGVYTLTTVSLAANQTGNFARFTGEALNFSYQFKVESGTPTGRFIVEVSNDIRCLDSVAIANARFEPVADITFTAGVAPNGSSGCAVLVQNGWMFSRCRWVFSSGTGTGYAIASAVSV